MMPITTQNELIVPTKTHTHTSHTHNLVIASTHDFYMHSNCVHRCARVPQFAYKRQSTTSQEQSRLPRVSAKKHNSIVLNDPRSSKSFYIAARTRTEDKQPYNFYIYFLYYNI